MTNNSSGNGFTNKEMLDMILKKLDEFDTKLDDKLDKADFNKVLGLMATVALVIAAFIM